MNKEPAWARQICALTFLERFSELFARKPKSSKIKETVSSKQRPIK